VDLDEHQSVRLRPHKQGIRYALAVERPSASHLWQNFCKPPNHPKQMSYSDVRSARLAGGRGFMPRAKRSAFVSRFSAIAAPSARGWCGCGEAFGFSSVGRPSVSHQIIQSRRVIRTYVRHASQGEEDSYPVRNAPHLSHAFRQLQHLQHGGRAS